MTDLDASAGGEAHAQYMIFLLVFFFFLTGLLGFLICHTLKKKGYRCRTGDLEDEECKDKQAPDDGPEDNQDTVEQILKCIIENEANMEAFKEMLGNQNPCEHNIASMLPRKESLGGVPPHHHTIHFGADQNPCHLCAQSRSKKARRRNRVPRSRARPGEQTVFSVGRFRVTHMEKKSSLQGSPNLQLKESGGQPDDSEPLDDQEDPGKEGYNLRNMFRDVSPNNGVVAVETTKRKKSVTLLGPWKAVIGEPAETKEPREMVAATMDAVIVEDNDDGGNCPDSAEQPESPDPPLEEGTDTDVPTDSEMTGDKGAAGDKVGAGDTTVAGDKVAVGDKVSAGDTIAAGDKVTAGDTVTEEDKVAAGASDKVAPGAGDSVAVGAPADGNARVWEEVVAGGKAAVAGAGEGDTADRAGPEQPVPARIREFSVVRTGEPAEEEEAPAPGEFGRDDMVEMEDIRDCRVSVGEDSRHLREEKRRSVHTQHKW